MSQLSELVTMWKKSQNDKFTPGHANPGVSRGATGSLGSRTFQGRDSNAGLKKELDSINSPIFQAFLRRQNPGTPVTDYLNGRK